jgi:arsenite methyltransferase
LLAVVEVQAVGEGGEMRQSYFAQVAEQWDALRATMFSDAVREAALARAALHPQAVVADIGAGTGFLAQGLAPHVACVHVVDSSPEMLRIARRKLAAFNNVQFHEAEGTCLPFADASLDAVLANMYLHHVTDPAIAIREMSRVLRPGGRLVITDLSEHAYDWLRDEHHDVWLGFARGQVQAWFEAAGLVNIRVENTRHSCCAQSQAGLEQASVAIFVASGMKPDPQMDEAVRAHYRHLAQGGAGCCGPLPSVVIPLEAIGVGIARDASAALEVVRESPLSLGCGNPVALADLQPGEVVLDIGCGAGADVLSAAERVGSTGRVIGVDVLSEMLERARRVALTRGLTNVEFRQGDALALPVAEESVDVVISNCVINLVRDKGRAFREAWRVLKPGGRLAISDIVTDRPFSPSLRANAESWVACVSGALSEEEYLALIMQAGFSALVVARSDGLLTEDGTQIYSLYVKAIK